MENQKAKNAQQGNELISMFQYGHMSVNGSVPDYHGDWNCLIPVIDKIEKMGFITAIHHDENYQNYMYHFFDKRSVDGGGKSEWLPNRIDAAWQAIVNFIKWYNGHAKA